ncbi:50S ribosomal protein L18, partial [Candidatus Peregrinibacteria bacterium]|nr:50S ribosomal protein L18 [Candidatus Peregrinibacteria bacterium]
RVLLKNRLQRKRRIRTKVRGSALRPRMTVFRSLRSLYVQVIDDDAQRTMAAVSTKECTTSPNVKGALLLGERIAEKALAAGVTRVVFDRNAYKYHGQVKALADAARKAGLQF